MVKVGYTNESQIISGFRRQAAMVPCAGRSSSLSVRDGASEGCSPINALRYFR